MVDRAWPLAANDRVGATRVVGEKQADTCADTERAPARTGTGRARGSEKRGIWSGYLPQSGTGQRRLALRRRPGHGRLWPEGRIMTNVTRRQLGAASAGLALCTTAAIAQSAPATVHLSQGRTVPALGQGSARLGQGRRPAAEEEDALRTGLSLGLTLIDTAEIYGEGRAEQMIGR